MKSRFSAKGVIDAEADADADAEAELEAEVEVDINPRACAVVEAGAEAEMEVDWASEKGNDGAASAGYRRLPLIADRSEPVCNDGKKQMEAGNKKMI